jgi:cytochrome P450
MASLSPFIPIQPPRSADWMPTWRGFFGERLRNTVYGIAEPAFDTSIRTRKILGITVHILMDPAAVERVLLGNKANYLRPRIAQRLLSPLVGNGLLSAEGEDWRTQRRIVAPTFAPAAVANMAETMVRCTTANIAKWPKGHARIDMAAEATDATMAIIANSLFAGDPRLVDPQAARYIGQMLAAAGQARFMTLLGLQNWDPSPVMRRARKSRDWLRQTLTEVVRDRGPDGGGDDFFGGLIRALGEHYPPDQAAVLAADNAITFYVAGHETTANALAWAMYCLAAQPELQEEARIEAISAMAYPAAERFEHLGLLKQIFEETMRLYPPAPRFDREAEAPDVLCDTAIAKGDLVSIWPWIIHRHRALWDDPDRFDHRRFAPERRASQHRFQYLPFGGGPRVCVGARFATMEALLIMAQWLSERRFALPPGFKPDPVGSVTLRPRGGMPLLASPV